MSNGNGNFTGTVIIRPTESCFRFFCVIEKGSKEICRVHIFDGIPVPIFDDFFSRAKWKKDRLIIFGREISIEIHVLYEHCEVRYSNKTFKVKPSIRIIPDRAKFCRKTKGICGLDAFFSPAIAANVRESESWLSTLSYSLNIWIL